ncbi:hypothetical protein Tsubulata_040610 [Turnera subulata]|uniref:WRKY domain-containing protein n=1 Tax=Turnera subulata TaxID=218843 RepID=A0A9Q0FJD4_9ROSI|nr:hypothetical protein Tsubulata_040610 [Turnera subulata]
MEKLMESEQTTLINELTQGKELTEQLRNHLNPSSPIETRQFLIGKILSSYEKALSILSWVDSVQGPKPTTNIITTLESPHSFANSSPRSEVFDQDLKDQSPKDVLKKRKTQPRWSEQVRVCLGTGFDGPLDDGHSWRKYGQKDILGAKFPRGYYRCTHRPSQGCLATKQVQRSDEDPTIFEVTYRGRHTCTQSTSKSVINDIRPGKNKDHPRKPQQQQQEQEVKPKLSKEATFNFGGLQVKTEGLDTREEEDTFPSFSFPYAPIGDELDEENNIFKEYSMESNFLGSLSPAFVSPTASESNYFSMSPCHLNNFGAGQNVQASESDLTEIMSAPNSVTNSPIGGDFDILLDNVNFDTSFSLDNLEFFG